jgi:hypothetical protein
MIRLVTFLFLITVFTSCKSAEPVDNKPVNDKENIYKNPVVNYSLPDPNIIRADDGYFYLFATEDIRNMPIHRSEDLSTGKCPLPHYQCTPPYFLTKRIVAPISISSRKYVLNIPCLSGW